MRPHTLVLAAFAALTACATSISNIPFSMAPAPPDGMALVYIYRAEPEGPSSLTPPNALIDGKPVLALWRSDYTALYVKAGKHTVSIEEKSKLMGGMPAKELTFEARPGGVHAVSLYYRQTPGPPMIGVAGPAGYFLVPMGPTPTRLDHPWAWDFYEDASISQVLYLLKTRMYQRPLTAEFALPK